MQTESIAPLWRLAFRPFFLFGSLISVIALFIWIGFLRGWMPRPGYFDPIVWHAHEMIYGFTSGIIAGFVLTASQNWTGKRGVHGVKLQILFGLWLLGRILMFAVHSPAGLVSAVVDLAFYPLLAAYILPYLKDPELKVERIFFVYFSLFFAGDVIAHLDAFGITHGLALKGVLLGLNAVILVIVFMGGRVIPFFTESTIAKSQPKIRKQIEMLSHISAWLFLLSQFFASDSVLAAGIAFFAGIIHLIRLSGWQVPRVRRVPILWVLHLSYLWLVLGFILTGFASLHFLPLSIAVHAITVGGIGGIIYGMISRVSLGHTGRPLHVSRWTVAGYYAVNVCALVRVLGPILSPGSYPEILVVSAGLWIIAFGIFLFIYAPMLMAPRIDGRPG